MKHKTTQTVTVKVGEMQVTRTCEATFFYDPRYGADADGNRGIATWELDDFKVLNETGKSDGGFTLTAPEMAQLDDVLGDALCEIDFSGELNYDEGPDHGIEPGDDER